MNWFSIQITLWPILLGIAIFLFKKQIGDMVKNISEITFGSFALKLRKRMKLSDEAFLKIKMLNGSELKFFFIIASQSHEIGKVTWKIGIDENIRLHEKLKNVGLIEINNLDSAKEKRTIDAKLTALGEDFYNELSSLISESIN